MDKLTLIRRMALFATFLALVVVLLGAWTRLSEAGLGCPDWPGCYGFLTVPQHDHHIQQAEEAFPHAPFEEHKAWPEMIHRYFAGSLGLVILAIFVVALAAGRQGPRLHAGALLALVVFQAYLGMLTVTAMLHPVIVMGHLLGGFSIVCLLGLLYLRLHPSPPFIRSFCSSTIVSRLGWLALVIVIVQIALGGWTSANYAAVVCTSLPICEGDWLSTYHFVTGFWFSGYEADTYQYGVLPFEGRLTIHVTHRIGAIIAACAVIALVIGLWKRSSKSLAALLLAILCAQIALGVTNVLAALPLAVAVSHNGGGLLLLFSIIVVLFLTNRVGAKEENANGC